jgi:hypothetical protein
MGRLVFFILSMMMALVLAGYVLAHFGFVVLLAIGLCLLGRHLRRHGA